MATKTDKHVCELSKELKRLLSENPSLIHDTVNGKVSVKKRANGVVAGEKSANENVECLELNPGPCILLCFIILSSCIFALNSMSR